MGAVELRGTCAPEVVVALVVVALPVADEPGSELPLLAWPAGSFSTIGGVGWTIR